MTLLDSTGRPIDSEEGTTSFDAPTACEKCSSRELKTLLGFGGHWRLICELCGTVVAAGRKAEGE
jgi:hypothetical protein